MEPVLLSFHAPAHDLDLVAAHVVRSGLAEHLRAWQRESGARELIYLATCQRVLWMLWGADAEAFDPGPGARRYAGEKAWTHLLAMTAGLESANLGDREIPGQLKDALLMALEEGVAGAEAQATVEDLIREGQRLRARLGLADGTVSVATAALKHLCDTLPPEAAVALVGVGPMTRYLAERLPERGYRVVVANRTRSKAGDLAHPLGLETVELKQLRHDPAGFQALVTATAAPEPLFTRAGWAACTHAGLQLLDLALPPDSDPALEGLAWVDRLDLNAFLARTATARGQRAEAARLAEPHLLAAAQRLRQRAQARGRKRHLGVSRARLAAAWSALEREVEGLHTPSGSPEGAECETLKEILDRGRTLAHRALMQTQFEHPTDGEAVNP